MLRTGAQFAESLRDGRRVYHRGKRIEDVASHPGFRGTVDTVASLYDLQHDPAQSDLTTAVWQGERIPYSYFPPSTPEHLLQKRHYTELWARRTFGQMGRPPAMLAEFVVGILDAAAILGKGRAQFGENAVNYHRHCAVNDLALTHALNDQYYDRSKNLHEQRHPDVALRIVKETSAGPVVRGLRALATQAALSHEVLVHPNRPRSEAEADYAIAFAIPLNAPGITIICRDLYAENAARDRLPLATRFDEVDCTLVFDDVLVPWERVFVYREPALLSRYFRTMAPFPSYSNSVRQIVRMEHFVAAAHILAQWSGQHANANIQAKIGQMVQDLEVMRACLAAAEAGGRLTAGGHWIANVSTAFRLHSVDAFGRAEDMFKEVLTSSLILTAGAADLDSGEIGPLVERYFGAAAPSTRDNLRAMAVAADMALSALGGRTQLYETLSGGEPHAQRRLLYSSYDFAPLTERFRSFIGDEMD
ncbi:MAG: 4-hydroxyphenylacetate 3-hydroxylase N-terminal domain-containing protein [Rhizomicrobium sp.]